MNTEFTNQVIACIQTSTSFFLTLINIEKEEQLTIYCFLLSKYKLIPKHANKLKYAWNN